MAGLTVQECLNAWITDGNLTTKLTAAKGKMTQVMPVRRAKAIEAATAQLPLARQLDVYSTILMTIATKAGATHEARALKDVVGAPNYYR